MKLGKFATGEKKFTTVHSSHHSPSLACFEHQDYANADIYQLIRYDLDRSCEAKVLHKLKVDDL